MKQIKAYLEITMNISENNRAKGAAVYNTYKQPFLNTINGALSKELLVRNDDVQVLHGFDSIENAEEYLKSSLFNDDVKTKLMPLCNSAPEIRIYAVI